ncbi:protein SOB FIVE-LIKE 3-like [Tripterygium wilfordii]|uniref:protein SOB FIVE-LIKE 3-like n=1 Tax=Tripterygium wilfordii TaxID=458696 RepID=UPI0018F7EBDC|nr:protein SOB FIVE-LIKE 3-like [Tripterygium wilfordii]
MDLSKHASSKEGCSSSESGWTMYITSPMGKDDEECTGDDNSDRHIEEDDRNTDDPEKESDDSMASDASSGPSHQQKLTNYRNNYGKTGSKHDKFFHQEIKQKKRGETMKIMPEVKENSALLRNTKNVQSTDGCKCKYATAK